MARVYKLTYFGKEVHKRLIDLDMSLTDLAREVGIKPPYLNELLRGSRHTVAKKEQICKRLGLNYEDLCGERRA